MIRARQFEYINVHEALKLIGGYEDIYRKLVHAFIENQRDLIIRIEDRLEIDRPEVRRLVHSIKGISQNLGAKQLYEISAKFEEAIINEASDAILEGHFETFKDIFWKTYEELKLIDEEESF